LAAGERLAIHLRGKMNNDGRLFSTGHQAYYKKQAVQ
jgi:hypothetical protein